MGQAPALAQGPARLPVGVEQRVVIGGIGTVGVAAVDRVFGIEPVFGVDRGRVTAVTAADFRAHAGQAVEQVFGAQRVQIVVGIAATIVVHGELGLPVQVQAGAEALCVLEGGQRAGGIAAHALLLDATQLAAERAGFVDAPLAGELGLGQAFIAALGLSESHVYAHFLLNCPALRPRAR